MSNIYLFIYLFIYLLLKQDKNNHEIGKGNHLR